MPDNRQLLLIAEPNSYRIAAFLDAASRLGLDVLIASRGHHSLVSEVYDGLHIDLVDQESSVKAILQHAKITPFAGVLGIDDSTVELAAKVARQLGLPHNSPDAAKLTRRKDLARSHLTRSGCLVPPHWLINLDISLQQQWAEIDYPCVVKPLSLSASRGVIRVNDKKELFAACNRIETILAEVQNPYEKRHLLVEKYIDGSEVAFEGYLYRGDLTQLVIFDKPDRLTGPYFEETIYVTPSRLARSLQINDTGTGS